jgi:hypothetical protein
VSKVIDDLKNMNNNENNSLTKSCENNINSIKSNNNCVEEIKNNNNFIDNNTLKIIDNLANLSSVMNITTENTE